MNGLKWLVHEIHRRSLWQVLAVYLAGSWVAVQVVDALTRTAGLPEWVPPFALVLLVIGFPVVMATAIVQEGGPSERVAGKSGRARAEAEWRAPPVTAPETGDASTEAARTTPDSGADAAPYLPSAPEPTGIQRWLTWRKAILGGVGAFALLGVSVAVYLAMWSAGVGPVGSLVAQGAIQQGDRVILATFSDATGEGLGAVVTGALRIDLAQGSILNLVEEAELAPVLERMQLPRGTLLTGELARDAAVREGIGAVLDGEVARAGTGYLITVTLREAGSGRSLAGFRVAAQGPDDIIPSMDRLSREIRSKAGESLRSVRAGEPLEQVTTRSLEALRLFTEADHAFLLGDLRQTLELLEQAVAIDPEFAMAWRRMAAALSTIGIDRSRESHAATQAFLHRDRLTERERYLTEAYYFSQIAGDRTRTIAAYQNVLRIAPDDRVALNNLGNEYSEIEDFARAEELYRRAVDGPGRTNTAFQNLIAVRIGRADFAGAEAAYREFEAAYPDNQNLPEWAFWVAFLTGDLATARSVTAPLIEDPGLPAFVRAGALDRMALASYREGRLDEGRAYLLASERLAGEVGPAFQLSQRQWTVHVEIVLGDREWAGAHARALLDDGTFDAIEPAARNWFLTAINFALLGDEARTDAVLRDWEAFLAGRGVGPLDRNSIERIRLVLAVTTGSTDGALEAFTELAAEVGCTNPTCWSQNRALAAVREGRTDEAIRLNEHIRQGGFSNPRFNGTWRVRAMLELGPLYEEAGDTAQAVEAYRRVVREWANADARGMEWVREAEARIVALTGEPMAADARP